MRMHHPHLTVAVASIALVSAALLGACQPTLYDTDRATRPYPSELHTNRAADIQVFREGTSIELRNATATSYANFDLWINQRYVSHVDALPAGGRARLSLWDFWDAQGEAMNAGGLFRVDAPTPVRLVEIQTSPDAPLVACIAIRAEEIVTE